MPVPVSVRPVRARMRLSLWISSHDASEVGSSEVWLSAALRTKPAGTERETKRAPPIFTKPRRVRVEVNGAIGVTGDSLEVPAFRVIEALAFPFAWRWRRAARRQ